ncbi:MAG: site-specific integrase [Verrucomicrobia bacterium]|nr:site-specific integrase [Verrucomicrobiota bacterium]
MDVTKRQEKSHGRTYWVLDSGKNLLGKRERAYFKSEEEADAELSRLAQESKKLGDWWARLPGLEREQLEHIYKLIKAQGYTLQQVWDDHQRWRRDNSHTCTTPMPYGEAVEEWERRKLVAGKSAEYIKEAKSTLLKFGEGQLKRHIHEISALELERWRSKQVSWKSANTQIINTSLFSSLWATAVSMGWASRNIVDQLEPVKRPAPAVEIYSNQIVINLLSSILDDTEARTVILATSVLGLFGCMRPEEIQNDLFGWSNIDLDNSRLTVPVTVAKTGDQRVVRLQPNCVEWLRYAKSLKNPLPAHNERKILDRCCESAGLTNWIRDGLRKCCATHLRAVYKNDYEVVRDCGNSVRILIRHYADLHVPEQTSLDYWRITPTTITDRKVP